MPRRVRGTVVSWANRFVGVPFGPAPPRPAAPPCAALTRPAYGMSDFSMRYVVIRTRTPKIEQSLLIFHTRSVSHLRSSQRKSASKIAIGPVVVDRSEDRNAGRPLSH